MVQRGKQHDSGAREMKYIQLVPTLRVGTHGREALRHWAWWLIAAFLLAALPIFLHGCHGDEDNELFAPLSWNLEQPGFRQ